MNVLRHGGYVENRAVRAFKLHHAVWTSGHSLRIAVGVVAGKYFSVISMGAKTHIKKSQYE